MPKLHYQFQELMLDIRMVVICIIRLMVLLVELHQYLTYYQGLASQLKSGKIELGSRLQMQ